MNSVRPLSPPSSVSVLPARTTGTQTPRAQTNRARFVRSPPQSNQTSFVPPPMRGPATRPRRRNRGRRNNYASAPPTRGGGVTRGRSVTRGGRASRGGRGTGARTGTGAGIRTGRTSGTGRGTYFQHQHQSQRCTRGVYGLCYVRTPRRNRSWSPRRTGAEATSNGAVGPVRLFEDIDCPSCISRNGPVSYTHLTLPTKRIV